MTGGRLRRRAPAAYLAAVSVLGTSLALARMHIGGGGTWQEDSVQYLAAARSLLSGAGLQSLYSDAPFTWWPPLYSFLLAAGGLFVDPLEVAGPLNSVALALTLFCFGRHLWARLDSLFLRLWAPLACSLSPPLADVAHRALSETVFILLTTLALVSVVEYLENGSRRTLIVTAVFSALAWQTRYLGAALLVTVGLLVLTDRRRLFRERANHLAIFGVIAAAPMAAWMSRNYRLSGRAITNFHPPEHLLLFPDGPSWRRTMDQVFGHLSSWTEFDWGPSTPAVVLALVLAAAFARWRLEPIVRWTSRRASPDSRLVTVWGVFWLVYFVCLVAGMMTGASWGDVQTRYVTPLYIPTLAVVAGLFDRLFSRARSRHSAVNRPFGFGFTPLLRISRVLCAVGLVSWLVGQVGPARRAITRSNPSDFDIGNYASARWAHSETMNALRRLPPSALRTNRAHAVFLHTGADRLYRAPSRVRDVAVDAVVTEWLDGMPDGSRIVWFRRWGQNRFAPTPLALRVSPSLIPVGEFADGTIFEIDRTSSPSMPWLPAIHFDSAVADSPDTLLVSDNYHLYFDEDVLWYFKEPCAIEDTEARFFLHLYPEDEADLPAERRGYGFLNFDFDFVDYGILSEGRCLAVVPLPEGRYRKFGTGQNRTNPWRVARRLDRDRYRAALASWARGEWGEPVGRAVFDLYRREEELRYVKEPCAMEDTEARFFLHLYPEDEADLPAERRGYGFLNFDFDFVDYGFLLDGRCLAIAPLPESGDGRLRAGQFLPGGELWSIEASLAPPP